MPVPVTNIYDTHPGERGAALIATVALLALLSVFMVVGLNLLHVEEDVDRQLETQQKLDFVMDQIATYVHRERRLPCPANPSIIGANFGTEDRAGANGGCNAINGEFTGIIPFRTLFISEHYARDRWGRYITYSISPVFGDTRNAAADADIFYICRKDHWVNDKLPEPEPVPPPPPRNENELKARFCCPGDVLYAPATDLVILDENNVQYNLRPDQGGGPAGNTPQRTTGAVSGGFGNVDTLVVDPVDVNLIDNENIVAFAVTLVSHGANGHGAFLGNGTANQFDVGAGNFGAQEGENADRDNIFVDRPAMMTPGSNNYFDDIVLWRTQFSLYNELNNATCSRAWR